jgi:hypothetical protein
MAVRHNAHNREHQRFAERSCRFKQLQMVFPLKQRQQPNPKLSTFRGKRRTRSQQEVLQQLIWPIDPRTRVISGQRSYPPA